MVIIPKNLQRWPQQTESILPLKRFLESTFCLLLFSVTSNHVTSRSLLYGVFFKNALCHVLRPLKGDLIQPIWRVSVNHKEGDCDSTTQENMDFSTKVNKSRSQRRIQKEGFGSYNESHNLQFYTLPPTEIISLQEFEDSAVERLKGNMK